MKTYKRIEKICNMVAFALKFCDKEAVIADIGTDHGFVADGVSKLSGVKSVLATDISEKSIEKVKSLIKEKKLTNIYTNVGDGLSAIDKADIAVIAGIGGLEITKIIDKQNRDAVGKRKCNIFVLQPAQNIVELRNWAISHHYKILKDITFEDNSQYYSVLVIDVSKFRIYRKSIYNLWLGRNSEEDSEEFRSFIEYLDGYLEFLDGVSKERIKGDKILMQKYKLRKLIKKKYSK